MIRAYLLAGRDSEGREKFMDELYADPDSDEEAVWRRLMAAAEREAASGTDQ